ncbi:Transposase OS=Candidatus Contendobacter odensis Run_B_J11 GN=BN874_2480005 PE=4 SV=1: HTH_29 [Gemmata massiliana]|uniref:Transposase n=1 Tax=Gemmata massiliana TaxID=1210884 RepID=A0A6P2CZB2_9BACT|nr:Transposase OS=Candidatus Contendobacter odensis Run_B_J11 GN=BN874_2480005 PE=4 SV=1: HTH_29 [Gemmata massiliana]
MEQDAKFVVRLDEAERGRLQEMVDRGQGSKTIRNRALILLKADEGEGGSGWTDAKIAEAFGVGGADRRAHAPVTRGRGLEAVLARKPSPNRQYRKLDGAQEAALVKLACSKPPHGRARWTLQLLADRLIELDVVPSIGREAVRTTLQKTTSSRGSASTGYYPRRPMPSSSVRWKTSSGCTTDRTTRRAPRYASTKPPSN